VAVVVTKAAANASAILIFIVISSKQLTRDCNARVITVVLRNDGRRRRALAGSRANVVLLRHSFTESIGKAGAKWRKGGAKIQYATVIFAGCSAPEPRGFVAGVAPAHRSQGFGNFLGSTQK
jgi:hypothetical protein